MAKFPMLCVTGAALLLTGCVSQQKYEQSQQKNADRRVELTVANPGK